MKPMLLSCFVLLAGTAARAQFSLLPQVGFEQSRTTLNYGSGLSALNASTNVKAGLKMNYQLKGGHTPFVNLTTAPAPVFFTFNNTGELMARSQSGMPKLMLQAGYQYSSKAIQLGKKTGAAKPGGETTTQRHGCGSAYRSRCGQQRSTAEANPVNSTLNMRLQPALALAYVPSAGTSLTPKGDGLEYKAANWNTAIVPSMGFEFAKGQQKLFTLSVFYTKPMGQTDQMATLASGLKAVPVLLQPKTTTWGMTLGIPFSFAKSTHSKPIMQRRECRRTCYRTCTRVQ